MKIGALNKRIQIQQESKTTGVDAFRQPTASSWTTICETWASIDIQNSQLIRNTAEFMDKVAYRITLRWTPTPITAKQRVVYTDSWGTHIYSIETVLNTKQANKELVLMCYALPDPDCAGS